MNLKAGVKSTEFYIALLPFVLVFVKQVFGIEFEQDKIVDLIMSIAGVISGAIYVWGRIQLKKEEIAKKK